MAYTSLAAVSWGTGPKIPITFYYDYQRSGSDMQYKIKIVVGTVSGSSYFGYPIYTTISLDSTAKVSGHTLKSASPSQWSSSITYETGWLTVSGKATGTTSLLIRMYSGSGSTRDTTYSYSLYVSPAATTPTLSASSVNMGSSVTITLNRASSGFTHNLTYSFGSLSGQTSGLSASSGVGTSAVFTPPLTLASQIPSATSGRCTITCKTYNGSTLIGTKTVSLTLNVPSGVVPTISSVSISEATSGLAEKFAAYVQNKSTLAVAITAAGAYGSTIQSYATTILGVKYSGSSFTSRALDSSGSVSISTTVTDSRGRTATHTETISVTAYSPPEISAFSAQRITTSGEASDDGNRVGVTMTYAISSVGGNNDHTYNLQYRKSSDVSFTSFDSGSASWTFSGTRNFTSAPEISTDYAHVIRLEITDYFQTVVYEVQLPTAYTLCNVRSTGKGFAFGKVSEKDALEVAMDAEFTGGFSVGGKTLLDYFHPVGSVYESTDPTSPATLFGGTWEQIKDVFTLAAGDIYTAGSTGGSADAVVVGHGHSIGKVGTTSKYAEIQAGGSGYAYPAFQNVSGSSTSPRYKIEETGVDGTGKNMPPYLVTYKWKRTA